MFVRPSNGETTGSSNKFMQFQTSKLARQMCSLQNKKRIRSHLRLCNVVSVVIGAEGGLDALVLLIDCAHQRRCWG
jgi:hypothetical protein